MIKNPLFLFASLIIIGSIIIIFVKISSDPFQKMTPGEPELAINSEQGDSITSLYAEQCATCHGNLGQGIDGYPPLQTSRLSIEEIKQIISQGKNKMPSFRSIMEPELTKLAELVKQF